MPGRYKKYCPQKPVSANSKEEGRNSRSPLEQQGRRKQRDRYGNPHLQTANHSPRNDAYHPAPPLHSQRRNRSGPGSANPLKSNPLRDITNPKYHARSEEVVSKASFLSSQLQTFVNGLTDFLKPDQEEMDWESTNTKELILVRDASLGSGEKVKPSLRLLVPDSTPAVHDTLPPPSHGPEGDRGGLEMGSCEGDGVGGTMRNACCANGARFIASVDGQIHTA